MNDYRHACRSRLDTGPMSATAPTEWHSRSRKMASSADAMRFFLAQRNGRTPALESVRVIWCPVCDLEIDDFVQVGGLPRCRPPCRARSGRSPTCASHPRIPRSPSKAKNLAMSGDVPLMQACRPAISAAPKPRTASVYVVIAPALYERDGPLMSTSREPTGRTTTSALPGSRSRWRRSPRERSIPAGGGPRPRQ